MATLLLTLNTAMASSIDRGNIFSDVPTDIEDSRERLLAQIAHYRQERTASRSTNCEDFLLLYSFSKIPLI